ncbi:MAG: YfhO family protein [Verrucomicrobia bacterium]|nr:YfhO family protein [Verrucomicrobiota bacterium]
MSSVEATDNFESDRAARAPLPADTGWAADDWFSSRRFGLLLGLALVAAFPLVVVGVRSFVFRDYGVLAYPFAYYQRQCCLRGEWPLWNPLSNCGAPFLAQWGTMVLYPLAWIYVWLPMPWALGFFCLGHLWLGGMGMHQLARRWTGSGFAAAVAGFAFVFNGLTLSCLIWPNYTVALGWMPWVLRWTQSAWRDGGRALLGAALVSALQLLAGVPEVTLLTWLLVGAVWSGGFQMADGKWQIEFRRFARLVAVVGLAAGLTAAQTLPFFDLLAHSQRDTGFATARWTLPSWGWADFLVPLFHCFETYQGVFFQHDQEFFSSVYLGLGPLMLAILACVEVRRRRVRLLAGIALLAFLLALGDQGLVYSWLRRLVPVLGFARFPVKFLVLTAFTVPLLAAFAVAHYQAVLAPRTAGGGLRAERPSPAFRGAAEGGCDTQADRPRRGARVATWRPIVSVGVGLLCLMLEILWIARRYPLPLDQWPATWHGAVGRMGFLALLWLGLVASGRSVRSLGRLAAQLATLLVLALDVLTHTPSQNPTVPASNLAPGLNELKPPPRIGEGRVMITPMAEEHLLRSRVRGLADDFVGKRLALWSNLNALDGIPKVNGSSTLQLREQAQVQSLLYATPRTDLPRLADFLGATNITAPGTVVEWTNRPTAMPWLTAGQQPVFADATNTVRGLTATNFEPRRVVYLPLEAKPFITVTQATDVRVLERQATAERVAADVDASRASLVVISQSYYHPWRAFVDGRRVRLWRANLAFQALEVPAGRHRVEVLYVDRVFEVGALISGATLVVLGGAWIRTRRATAAATN